MVMENKKNERLVFDIRRKLKPWQEHYLKSYGIFPQKGEFLGCDSEGFDCYYAEFSWYDIKRGLLKECELQAYYQGYEVKIPDGLTIGFDYDGGHIFIQYENNRFRPWLNKGYDIFVKSGPDKINMTFRCPKTGEEVKAAVFYKKEKVIQIVLYSDSVNANDTITISRSSEICDADDYTDELETVIGEGVKDPDMSIWLKAMVTDPRLREVLCKLLSRIRRAIDNQDFQGSNKEHQMIKATENR